MNKEELHGFILEHAANICGIAAMKNGTLQYLDAFNGFTTTDTAHVMSVTKSVVSLLVGIAIDQGLIKGVHQKVLDFFPEYRIKRGEKTIQSVTIENLLTMTAPYKYRSEPWTKVCTSENWTNTTLDLLGGRAGITGEFRYSTLGVHILTAIIAKQSRMGTAEYANRYLFAPLGVAPHVNFEAKSAEAHKEFTISKQPKKDIWFVDPQGIGTAGYGLCLSAQDMARIGQLCLDGGCCNGDRIISSDWIIESTRPRIQCDEQFGSMEYGYLWWTPKSGKPAYAALGNSGNVIYVNPENGTVIAVNATFQPRVFDRVDFIQKYIEPIL